MAFEWFSRMIRDRRPGVRKLESQGAHRPGRRTRLSFDLLEDRRVPAVSIVAGVDGADGNSTGASSPPNTQVAYGPSAILETYSTGALLTPKIAGKFAPVSIDLTTGAALFTRSSPSVPITSFFSQPFVVYDDAAQRFIIGDLETDPILLRSWLHFAVSNDSTPTNFDTGGANSSFLEVQSIELSETGTGLNNTTGLALGSLFATNPNVGYNADGLFFTFNMESFTTSQAFDHALIVSVEKATVLDANPSTMYVQPFTGVGALTNSGFNRPAPTFGLVPARMHNAPPGSPEYFVSTVGQQLETVTFSSTAIQVVQMTNYFTPNPGFVTTTLVVPNFGSATSPGNTVTAPGSPGLSPNIVQPGNSGHGSPLIGLDTQMFSVAWAGNHLVAAQTAVINQQSTVQWYEISTAVPQTATVIQTGDQAPGPGIYTYAPAIDISPTNLDIGLTYGESSTIENPSVYVTGRTQSDPPGRMETAARAILGTVPLGSPTNVPPIPFDMSGATNPLSRAPVASAPAGTTGVPATDGNFYQDAIGNTWVYDPEFIVDRSGLTPTTLPPPNGTHTNRPFDPLGVDLGSMWRTDPEYKGNNGVVTAAAGTGSTYDPVVGQVLTFNFGRLVSLNSVHIWNYNSTDQGFTTIPDPTNPFGDTIADFFTGTQFGAKQIQVFKEFSPIDPNPILVATLNLQQASGSNADPGEDFSQISGVNTQFLKFVFISNFTTSNSPGNVDGGAAKAGTWGTVGLSEVQFYVNPPPGNVVGNSSIQVDPLHPNTFVASSAYGKVLPILVPPFTENFGTWISSFLVSAANTPTVNGISPLRWVDNPLTGQFSGTYTVTNTGSALTGSHNQLSVTIVLPSSSITVVGGGGTQVGNLYIIPFNGTIANDQTLSFTLKLLDPLKVPLPTGLGSANIFFD